MKKKKNKKRNHFMDESLEMHNSIRSVRKPVKPTRVMSSKKDTRKKKWDYRDELD